MREQMTTEEGDLDRPITPILDQSELDHLFTYHPPRDGQRERYELLREHGKTLAQLIYELTPPGGDQSAAIRKVREAVMTANAAIACEGEMQTAYYARKLERSLQRDERSPQTDEGGK